jgi:hypothetical protein
MLRDGGEKKRSRDVVFYMFARSSHFTRVWKPLKAVHVMLCRKGTFIVSGVTAAEHSRTTSKRSQPTRFVISVHTYTKNTHGISLLLFFFLAPPRQRHTSQKRVSHWVSFSTTSRIRTNHIQIQNNNALAAVTLHGLSREDQHIQHCL